MKTTKIKKVRFTIEFKAGYRIVDNKTNQYVGNPIILFIDAIREARTLNLKELNRQEVK